MIHVSDILMNLQTRMWKQSRQPAAQNSTIGDLQDLNTPNLDSAEQV